MAQPTTMCVTISEESSSATEVFNSVKVSLADLCAKGTAQYAHKRYEEAADCYARASELQAELNGEMSPDNAEILFLYGRALFKVGQNNSNVLGGVGGAEKRKSNGAVKSKKAVPKEEPKSEDQKVAEEGISIVAEKAAAAHGGTINPENTESKKALFTFTGDENFEDSDDEEEAGGEEEEEEEEEDDLAAAFEVLDLARVLFAKKLEQPESGEEKGKSVGDSQMTKHIKERLSDTLDLLAEISLETERFPNAITDFRSALQYKIELYPEESEIIAEAHFKLSLALEFASITTTADGGDGAEDNKDANGSFDQGMRDEAVKELELAIRSTKLKLDAKEVELATSHSPDDNDVTRTQIAEVKDILGDMEQRLTDLKGPPVDVNAALGSALDPTGGVLAATIGEKPAEAAARMEEAKKNANDLSGLVRRKPTESSTNGNGKRKAEDESEDIESKKTKVEDVVE